MKKIHFIACFVLILLLVSGASSCQTGKKTTVGNRYIGGTDGLVASFMDGEPPESVLDAGSEPFTITVLLDNKGESDINEGTVKTTLAGVSQNAFSIASLTKVNEGLIEGKRKEANKIIEGGQDAITYEANYKNLLFANFPTTVSMQYCYNYKTRAVADVCLRRDVGAKVKETDACKIVETKTVSSSSAPIQIISLSEAASRTNEVRVTFTIENKGKGTPYNVGSFASGDCMESQSRLTKDYVYVSVSSQEGLPIKCTKFTDLPAGNVKLIQGQTSILCKIDTTNLQATTYTVPLDITVDYVYKDFISQALTVEHEV